MIDALLDCGLLQFGQFEDHSAFKPYLINFHMLPAYPGVLQTISASVAEHVQQVDRLLCSADSLPLGVAVSLQTGVPLVYSRGQNHAPAYDLIGAYDVGHPALLLVNILDDVEKIDTLIKAARSVGLDVINVIAVIRVSEFDHLPTHSLLDLVQVVDDLVNSGYLPEAQGNTVKTYFQLNRQDAKR